MRQLVGFATRAGTISATVVKPVDSPPRQQFWNLPQLLFNWSLFPSILPAGIALPTGNSLEQSGNLSIAASQTLMPTGQTLMPAGISVSAGKPSDRSVEGTAGSNVAPHDSSPWRYPPGPATSESRDDLDAAELAAAEDAAAQAVRRLEQLRRRRAASRTASQAAARTSSHSKPTQSAATGEAQLQAASQTRFAPLQAAAGAAPQQGIPPSGHAVLPAGAGGAARDVPQV